MTAISEKPKFVPKLRFSDFDRKWVTKRIDEIFHIRAGGDIDKNRFSRERSNDYPYPIFANSNLNKGLYGYASYFVEEGNCVTVSGRGHLGVPHARSEKFVPIVRLLVLRPKQISSEYFYEAAISRIKFFR